MLRRKMRTAIALLRTALQQRLLLRQQWHGNGGAQVLFVADAEGATYRYRVQNQIEQVQLAGFDAASCYPNYLDAARLVQQCQLLMLYRPDDSPVLRAIVQQARKRAIPIVYDTDDLTWDARLIEYAALERYHGTARLPQFRKRIERERAVLGLADYVITSTEYLAGLARQTVAVPVFTNQNALGQQIIQQQENQYHATRQAPPNPSRSLVLGYFSGWAQAHEIDLAVALPAIQQVLTELPQARLRVVGHFDIDWLPHELHAQIEQAPFVAYQDLFQAIAAVDINLAPLVDNPHRRSKSAIKFLEAALIGVPTIASDLEPYQLIRHGETGMLAATSDQWYTSIMALAQDAGLRYHLGNAAHAYVLANHTTKVQARQYAEVIRQLLG
jgi:glycosyltransferase involved in cell wall biosynthesis